MNDKNKFNDVDVNNDATSEDLVDGLFCDEFTDEEDTESEEEKEERMRKFDEQTEAEILQNKKDELKFGLVGIAACILFVIVVFYVCFKVYA